MSSDITPLEIELARARIRKWAIEERESLARMSEDEVGAIVLLTALLDIRPVDEIPEGCIEIP